MPHILQVTVYFIKPVLSPPSHPKSNITASSQQTVSWHPEFCYSLCIPLFNFHRISHRSYYSVHFVHENTMPSRFGLRPITPRWCLVAVICVCFKNPCSVSALRTAIALWTCTCHSSYPTTYVTHQCVLLLFESETHP